MLGLIDMRDSVGKPRKKNTLGSLKLGHQLRNVSGSGLGSKPSRSHAKNATKSQLYLRSSADLPELVRDTISEENTPVSTPTHAEFDLRIPSGRIKGGGFDKKAASYAYLYARRTHVQLKPSPLFDDEAEKENVPPSPLANKSRNPIKTRTWRSPCPPAPRTDTGTFDTSLHNPAISFDSGADQEVDLSLDIPGTQAHFSKEKLPSLKDVSKSKELRVERGTKSAVAAGSASAPVDYPPAPRPDTGSWSSDMHGSVPRGSELGSGHMGSELPYRTHLGSSNKSRASTLDSKLTSRLSIPVPSKSGRARTGLSTDPNAGWDMGRGLELDMIFDPSTPPLGEPVPSMFGSSRAVSWADVSCERCLDKLFPGAPRPWIATAGEGIPVPGAATLVHLHTGSIQGERGRISGGGPRLVTSRRVERPFEDKFRPTSSSVWTRPIVPITALLPPIDLDRQRVGM